MAYVIPLRCRWLHCYFSLFQQTHNICVILCHLQRGNITIFLMDVKEGLCCLSILIYQILRRHVFEEGNLHSCHPNMKSHDTMPFQNVYERTWCDSTVCSGLEMQILINGHEYCYQQTKYQCLPHQN
jgi:hypothetical protein